MVLMTSILSPLLKIMQSINPEVAYKDWLAADSFDVSRRLKSIKTRCLLICGENDPLTPSEISRVFEF